MNKNRAAFSLVELLIGIIAIACIMAAVTPIVIKKMNKEAVSTTTSSTSYSSDCADTFGDKCTLCEGSEKCLTCTLTCDDGYYQDTDSCSCKSCTLSNCAACSSSSICTLCNSGYYLSSGSCVSCPAGYYCDGLTKTKCPKGTYSPSNASSCTDCSSGYYANSTGSTSCSLCSNKTANCISCEADTGSCTKCSSGYYPNNENCTSCPDGYWCDGSTKTQCSSATANCSTCTASTGTCTACNNGYTLTDGSCVKDWCSTDYGLVKVGSLCVTQYNIGDHSNYPIPSAAGVTVNSATSSASSTCSTCSTPICWQATDSIYTADEDNCDSANGSYSGCKRTVCNWCAATAICDNLSITINGTTYSDWRTPTQSELSSFDPDTYSKSTSSYAGDNGLMLCDRYSGDSSAQCQDVTHCSGSCDGYCFPHRVWSSEEGSSSNAYSYFLSSGVWFSNRHYQTLAFSVRCVHDI